MDNITPEQKRFLSRLFKFTAFAFVLLLLHNGIILMLKYAAGTL